MGQDFSQTSSAADAAPCEITHDDQATVRNPGGTRSEQLDGPRESRAKVGELLRFRSFGVNQTVTEPVGLHRTQVLQGDLLDDPGFEGFQCVPIYLCSIS